MDKLTLDLEALAVETFELTPEAVAMQLAAAEPQTISACPTDCPCC